MVQLGTNVRFAIERSRVQIPPSPSLIVRKVSLSIIVQLAESIKNIKTIAIKIIIQLLRIFLIQSIHERILAVVFLKIKNIFLRE